MSQVVASIGKGIRVVQVSTRRCLSECVDGQANVFINLGDSNMVGSGSVLSGSTPVWDKDIGDFVTSGELARGSEQVTGPLLVSPCSSVSNYFLKIAGGGEELERNFKPGRNRYIQLNTELPLLIAKLQADGFTSIVVRGIIFNIGTNDAVNQMYTDAFEQNLRDTIAGIRTDLSIPSLEFLLTDMPSTLDQDAARAPRVEQIRTALATVANDTPGVFLQSTEGWESGRMIDPEGDPVHYNLAGQTSQGQAYARFYTHAAAE